MDDAKSQEPVDAEIVDDSTDSSTTGVSPAQPVEPQFDYTEGGVPTFDYVRDRIEGKYATSVGAEELANESAQGRSIDEQMAERDRAGRDKLEEIRRQMRGE